MRRHSLIVLAVAAMFAAPLTAAPSAVAGNVARTYPGAAPCDTTLQACINAAAPGDTVVIATGNRIDEDLTISKSLTLTAAPGVHPVIGSADPATPRTFSVTDSAGGPVDVTVSRLSLSNARVAVYLYTSSGNTVRIVRNIIAHRTDSSNARGVDVDVRVPNADVLVLHNTIRTSGQPVNTLLLLPGASDHSSITVTGNTLTTSWAANAYHGITIDMRGTGHPTVNAYSNVIHHVMGCFCGAPGAISVFASDVEDATANVVGNTIDHTERQSPGVYVLLGGTATHLLLNLFDNVISRSSGAALGLPTHTDQFDLNAGFNDFYRNGAPSALHGYSLGRTLHVDPGYRSLPDRDYRPVPSSPVRDAGLVCTPGGLSRPDAARHFRLEGKTVDLGAYEVGSPAVPTGRNIFGTAAANHLVGTTGADIICGYGGADTLVGAAGADYVNGGPGADTLRGKGGRDILDSRDGHGGDTVAGGPGTDVCRSDPGDQLSGCP